jgi:hypothetical protein
MKHYISLVILSVVVIFGGLYLSLTNPANNTEDTDDQSTEELQSASAQLLLSLSTAVPAGFSAPEEATMRWNINRGGAFSETSLSGSMIKAQAATNEQAQAVETFFAQQGFTKNILNVAAGTVVSVSGLEKDFMVCSVALETSMDVGSGIYLKIICAELDGTESYISLSDFLAAPVQNTDVDVTGTVDDITGASCEGFCFALMDSRATDGESMITVRYADFEAEGETWKNLTISNLTDGDSVVISGELRINVDSQELWAKNITVLSTAQENAGMANPASTNCVTLGGSTMIMKTKDGEVGYCVLPDERICEEWDLFYGQNCTEPVIDYTDADACNADCETTNATEGECLWSNEAIQGDTIIGSCLIENSRHCGGIGSCNCYCHGTLAP